VLLNISEEAAATKKTLGEMPPEIEQGTPVEEVSPSSVAYSSGRREKATKRDPKALKAAPQVFKETPGSQRSYSTEASVPDIPPKQFDIVDVHAGLPAGAKFSLPDLPLPPTSRLRHRYSPIVDQVTNLIMQDGKVSSTKWRV
jgi:small subunit ribosomal protein S7